MLSQLFLTQLLVILAKTNGFMSGPMYLTDLTRLHHSLFKLQDMGKPQSFKGVFARDIKHVSTMGPKFLALAGILNVMGGKIQSANAIGEIAELKQQKMALQDISFNVLDPDKEAEVLSALFQRECKVIRNIEDRDQRQVVVAFGADAYRSPPSFHPGISTFLEDGGHATISFVGKKFNDDGLIELNEAGNGFKYIKVGAETIRLSKAIEAGILIRLYSYSVVHKFICAKFSGIKEQKSSTLTDG